MKQKKKFTSLYIPRKLRSAVDMVIDQTGEPLFWFENQAVEKFIEEEQDVDKKYRNGRHSSPDYIKRDKELPLYLEENLMNRLNAYKDKIRTTKSNCVMQALENSCVEKAEKYSLEIDLKYGEEMNE